MSKILKNNQKKSLNSILKFLLTALAGLIASSTLKHPGLSYISLFSLVIPIVLIFESKSFKQTAAYGLVFGFAYYFTLNDWFVPLLSFSRVWVSIGWVLGSFYLSLFTLGAFLSIKVIHRRIKNPLLLLLFVPIVWTGFDFLKTLGLLSFPFGSVGYSLIGTVFQKSAVFWGWPGLTFIVVSTNVFFVICPALIREKKYLKIISIVCVQAGLLVIASSFFVGGPKPDVKVSAIKTDFSSIYKFEFDQIKKNNKVILKLTKEALKSKPSFILWPEAVFSSVDYQVLSSLPNTKNLVFGSHRRNGEKVFNSAFIWNNDKVKFLYDKNRPVLFGEYVPWQFLESFVPGMENSLTPGSSKGVFYIDKQRAGIAICSESSDSLNIKGLVDNGAGLIAVITNDEWFKGSSMLYQHFQITRLRAIESGRYLVISANGMPSAVIGPDGRFKSTNQDVNGYVDSKVKYIYEKTVYDMYGWIIPYIALLLIGFIIILEIIERKRQQ